MNAVTVEFRGLVVAEPESGLIRFTGYAAGRDGQTSVVVCHVSRKTLGALCKQENATTSDLIRTFERHRTAIVAAAEEKYRRGEAAPVVTMGDILLKR